MPVPIIISQRSIMAVAWGRSGLVSHWTRPSTRAEMAHGAAEHWRSVCFQEREWQLGAGGGYFMPLDEDATAIWAARAR